MMFIVSKLLSGLTQPLAWVALCWLLALLMLGRRRQFAVSLLWAGLAGLGLLGFQAMPDALLRSLENRYTPPTAEMVRTSVGVIVLGGALDTPASFVAHEQVPLNEAAERMTQSVRLMRDNPAFTLVFTGGEGTLRTTGVSEAQMARAFFREQGVAPERTLVEGQSRNTRENARRVAELLGEKCRQPWLLVTSASHMSRAVTEFEWAGCRVIPYPVDYRTGHETPWSKYAMVPSLSHWEVALHEWLGMAAYRLTR